MVDLLLSPGFALAARLRGGRAVHRYGRVYHADVVPVARGGPFVRTASRLAGRAWVRLSRTIWRDAKLPDLLGIAIRFSSSSDPTTAARGDQDLLAATLRSVFTAPFALLTTDVEDFLANDYYALGTFEDADAGLVEIRIAGPGASPAGGTRDEKLDAAVRAGVARFVLEMREPREEWRPVAEITLRRPAGEVPLLRFDPFRDGRGLTPRGFLHDLRRATYLASRASSEAER